VSKYPLLIRRIRVSSFSLYNPLGALFIHAPRLLTDHNALTTTTYSKHIPPFIWVSASIAGNASPGHRQPLSPRLVPTPFSPFRACGPSRAKTHLYSMSWRPFAIAKPASMNARDSGNQATPPSGLALRLADISLGQNLKASPWLFPNDHPSHCKPGVSFHPGEMIERDANLF
jgi:hypothetical protein